MKIQGTAYECLMIHLSLNPPVWGEPTPLIKLLNTDRNVLYRWRHTENKPSALKLLCLMFYLEYLGYETTELRLLKAHNEQLVRLAEMVAYRVLPPKELAEIPGYKSLTQTVHDLMTTGKARQLMPARRESLVATLEHHALAIDAARDEHLAQLSNMREIRLRGIMDESPNSQPPSSDDSLRLITAFMDFAEVLLNTSDAITTLGRHIEPAALEVISERVRLAALQSR